VNLRHATALTLVGWYLMVPPKPSPEDAPTFAEGTSEADKNAADDAWLAKESTPLVTAPLNQWSIVGSFDNAAQCSSELAYINSPEGVSKISPQTHKPGETEKERLAVDLANSLNARIYELAAKDAECVATDDPRLAK
jgi:hypothetical protein